MDLNCALLQVCDSILNIGPCANASMGEPAFLSEEVHAVINFHCFGHCFQAFTLYFKVSDFILPTVPEQP